MSNEFQEAINSLDERLAQADEAIRALHLGVSGEVQLDNPGERLVIFLVYGGSDRDPKRTLHIEVGPERSVRPFHGQALGLMTRQRAARAVPLLVQRLRDVRETTTVAIQKDADDLDAFLDGLAE